MTTSDTVVVRASVRRDVQGLRAVAVVAVIGDHFFRWPNGGFIGVDIFFVISGYLITGMLVREYEHSGSINWRRFYARRFKRLMPAGMFVLGVTACMTLALLGFGRFKDVGKDVFFSTVFAANWHFATAGVDYFRESLPPSPVQHYWSLSVEEQFYLVWPWVMLALLVLGTKLGWWGRRHTRLVAGTAVVVLVVASFTWACWETAGSPTIAYFSTASRAWEMGVGALVAIAGSRLTPASARVRGVLALVGLFGIILAVLVVPQSPGFPAPWGLLPVLATALVLAAGRSGDRGPQLLTHPVGQFLGEISYSLYLWHFPVIVLLLSVVPDQTLLYWLIGGPLMLALSWASYRWIESPARRADWFRRNGSDRLRPRAGGFRYATACAGASAIAGLVAVGVIAVSPPPAKSPGLVLAGQTGDNPTDCHGAAALDPTHDCEVNNGPAVSPSYGRLPDDDAGAYDCYSFAFEPLRRCTYGPADADLEVALVGDSHAAALLPALEPQLEARRWRISTFFGNGCQWRERPPGQEGNCRNAMPDIQRALESGRYDFAITTARRSTGVATPEQYAAMLNPVVAAGTPVIVLADVPGMDRAAMDCIGRVGLRPARGCETDRDVAFAEEDSLAGAVEIVPGSHLVDLQDLFCTPDECQAIVGNTMVYRDSASHVTATFSRTLGPYLVEAIEKVLGSGGRSRP